MLRLIALSVTALLVFQSCKTYKANNLPKKRIEFGSGGGFTGFSETYYLLRNGQVFYKHTLDTLPKAYAKIKRKTAKSLYKKTTHALIPKYPVSQPGNIYYFLTVSDKDTLQYTWSPGASETLYLDTLYQNISKSIFKPQINK